MIFCVCAHAHMHRRTCMLLDSSSMGTLMAWAEWGASRIRRGRQAGWVTGPLLIPVGDVRPWGLSKHAKGKYQKDGPGRQIPEDICRPPSARWWRLRQEPGSGRQCISLALGPLEGSKRGCQSIGSSLSRCWISRWVCQLDSSTLGGSKGGGHSSPPCGPHRHWPGPTCSWWRHTQLVQLCHHPCLWHPHPQPRSTEQ